MKITMWAHGPLCLKMFEMWRKIISKIYLFSMWVSGFNSRMRSLRKFALVCSCTEMYGFSMRGTVIRFSSLAVQKFSHFFHWLLIFKTVSKYRHRPENNKKQVYIPLRYKWNILAKFHFNGSMGLGWALMLYHSINKLVIQKVLFYKYR